MEQQDLTRPAPKPAPPRRRRRAPLGAQVQQELERLIADGTLSPGERLNEVAIGRRLGVSRGPVREAARALEKTGLVTVIMNRGAFVRMLSLDEALAIYELNAVIFGLAAGLVAAGLTAGQALALRDLVDGMDRAIAAADRDGFFERNVAFHARIMEFCPNREASGVYLGYARKLLLLRRRSFEREGHMAQANREHRALLEAMLAGDAARARELAEAHARAGRARFLSAIDRPSDAPAETGAAARRRTA